MKRILSLLPLLFVLVTTYAQERSSHVRFINPSGLPKPTGYSHASIIDLGNSYMVIISGQVSVDSTGAVVGKGDMGKQTEQVFLNIKNIITAAGGSMSHLVKLGFFTRDVSQLQAIRTARNKFLDAVNPPASTLVEISGLVNPDFLIEIEATAIIPKK